MEVKRAKGEDGGEAGDEREAGAVEKGRWVRKQWMMSQ